MLNNYFSSYAKFRFSKSELVNLDMASWNVSSIDPDFASLTITEYDPMSCLQYKLTSSYDRMTDVGPVIPLRVTEEGTSQGREAPPVDPARLLVKAWEDKVFPVIRRRFRSNTDRQSGLEQIKGALLAGT